MTCGVPGTAGNSSGITADALRVGLTPPPVIAGAVPPVAARVPLHGAAVPTAISRVPTVGRTIPTASGAVPTASGTVFTASGTVPTERGSVPTAGGVIPASGEKAYAISSSRQGSSHRLPARARAGKMPAPQTQYTQRPRAAHRTGPIFLSAVFRARLQPPMSSGGGVMTGRKRSLTSKSTRRADAKSATASQPWSKHDQPGSTTARPTTR